MTICENPTFRVEGRFKKMVAVKQIFEDKKYPGIERQNNYITFDELLTTSKSWSFTKNGYSEIETDIRSDLYEATTGWSRRIIDECTTRWIKPVKVLTPNFTWKRYPTKEDLVSVYKVDFIPEDDQPRFDD